MRESLKKPLLFAVIVVVGSILVLFDVPLVILFPLVILIGFGTLLAVGSITIAEIRGGIAGLGKTGVLKRLNDIKFFEKKPADATKAVPPAPAKAAAKKEQGRENEAKPGIAAHISTFFSSIGSLGSVLRQKSRQKEKKVEEINKLLDRTVTEKVSAPPPATALSPQAGGGGSGPGKAADTEDPFMSFSGDEFDEGLLDGLGEEDGPAAPSPAREAAAPQALSMPDLTDAGPDLPEPSLDISSAAGDILREAGEGSAGGLEEFSGLDADSLSDEDFGDLDNLSLDDVDPDGDFGDAAAAPLSPDTAPGAPAHPAPAAAPAGGNTAVKTAWIPSDAPKNAGEAEDEVSTQADMAAFASGSGADEDLLSSIASDVKHVKKEQDLSLLRDLRDFKAPASEIEKELGGVYERMGMAPQVKKKDPSAPKGIK